MIYVGAYLLINMSRILSTRGEQNFMNGFMDLCPSFSVLAGDHVRLHSSLYADLHTYTQTYTQRKRNQISRGANQLAFNRSTSATVFHATASITSQFLLLTSCLDPPLL